MAIAICNILRIADLSLEVASQYHANKNAGPSTISPSYRMRHQKRGPTDHLALLSNATPETRAHRPSRPPIECDTRNAGPPTISPSYGMRHQKRGPTDHLALLSNATPAQHAPPRHVYRHLATKSTRSPITTPPHRHLAQNRHHPHSTHPPHFYPTPTKLPKNTQK